MTSNTSNGIRRSRKDRKAGIATTCNDRSSCGSPVSDRSSTEATYTMTQVPSYALPTTNSRKRSQDLGTSTRVSSKRSMSGRSTSPNFRMMKHKSGSTSARA
jgi:hypothetical protein